jgi:hypothetical protein
MSLDGLLIAIIIIGIGLSGAYLKAEYELHVRLKTAERRPGVALHDLPASRLRIERNGIPVHVWIARAPMQSQPQRQLLLLFVNDPQAKPFGKTARAKLAKALGVAAPADA